MQKQTKPAKKACRSCRVHIMVNNPEEKINIRSFNCKECDPSTKDKKYRYDDYLGWISDYLEAKCICGVKIFYTNPFNPHKRCANCDPSDFHNKYKYDAKTGNYTLYAHNEWSETARKHIWSNRNTAEQLGCKHCQKQEDIENKMAGYITKKDKIKRVQSDSKKTDITLKGNLFEYTPMDKNVISIIEEYYGKKSIDNADLSGLNLSGLDLSGYDFFQCNFEGTNLTGCNLTGSTFGFNSMIRTNLNDIITDKTYFAYNDLSGATFTGIFNSSEIIDCNLIYTRFKKVYFHKSRIGLCVMKKSSFKSTYFDECTLKNLDMTGARLGDISFDKCQIKQTILAGQNLDGVNFTGSDLSETNFKKCSMIGAILKKCTIICTILDKVDARNACFDGSEINFSSWINGDFRDTSFLDTIIKTSVVKGAHFKGAKITGKYTLARSFFDGAGSRP